MAEPLQEEGTASTRYTILGRLAGGGMAEIFLARAKSDAGVERHVVLKRVLPERSRDPAFAAMFLDEARLAAQLRHANIAQVHDIGRIAGAYFFTMEYVHGEDARAIQHRLAALRRPLPVNLALHVVSGALAGLHHAHERAAADGTPLGIVHRDVSPANLMVGYDGTVKLLDFGVAKAAQRQTESRSGTIKGKISYLSPEQCVGEAVDRRSDLFALGIVMWELLVGRRLFKRDTDFASMTSIVAEDVPPPSRERDGISPELERVVMTALAKSRDERFATAATMLDAIETIVAAERMVATAAAMARFMRDLFGERPEPWSDLEAREDHDRPITVTSESIIGAASVTPIGGPVTLEAQLLGDDPLEARLHAAPIVPLHAIPPTPPTLPREPARRPGRGVLVAGAAAAIAAGVTLAIAFGGGGKSQEPPASSPTPAPSITPIAEEPQPTPTPILTPPPPPIPTPAAEEPPPIPTPSPHPPPKRREPARTKQPPTPPPPPRDPCESKSYRTDHPLKCQ